MSDNREFEYEGFHVSVIYNPSTNSVTRIVSESGTVLHQDELQFDKSLVGNFELMSAEEQAKIATAWGAAGIKSRIEDGRLGVKN
ncbi:MAG: hypothetical protein K0Q67_1827 [Cellvibrio sp.]|jgi:hypothetical protein|nr:hypothetical protein [Cellvibrio sp.]